MGRLILGLLFVIRLGAQDALVQHAFNHFYNLEYDQAQADFEAAIARDPASPDLRNHLAETILFREMYRDGALESELVSGNNSFLRRPKLNPGPEVEKRFLDAVGAAMSLSEARLRRNPRDVDALYALGIAYGLRANYYWVVRKAWHDSLRDATESRKLHNRVSAIQPDNVDARLTQGLHDYIVGSLPMVYRMLGFLVGFHGDKMKGIETVEDVARRGKTDRVDAEILLCALYRRETKAGRAVPLLQDLIRRYPRNALFRFELAQMYADSGQGAKALAAVQEVAGLKMQSAPGFAGVPWEKIWFQLGTIEFWYNDLAGALENMRRVTGSRDELDLNTGVQAWLRTGQIYDLTGRRPLALEAYKKAMAYAPEADAARESQHLLSTPYHRRQRL